MQPDGEFVNFAAPRRGVGLSGALLKAAATVGGNTVISRVLGLVRDCGHCVEPSGQQGYGRFLRRLPPAEFSPPVIRRGCLLPGFRADSGRVQEPAQPRRGQRQLAAHVAGTLGRGAVGGDGARHTGGAGAGDDFRSRISRRRGKVHASTVQMVRITFPYILFVSLTAFRRKDCSTPTAVSACRRSHRFC